MSILLILSIHCSSGKTRFLRILLEKTDCPRIFPRTFLCVSDGLCDCLLVFMRTCEKVYMCDCVYVHMFACVHVNMGKTDKNARIDRRTRRQMDADRRASRQMDERTDERTDEMTDRGANGQTNRWIDGQAGRQDIQVRLNVLLAILFNHFESFFDKKGILPRQKWETPC